MLLKVLSLLLARRGWMFLLLLAGFAGPAAAEETPAGGEVKWSGSAELGIVLTSGNTESRSTTGKFKFLNQRVDWRHRLHADGYKATDKGTVTAENYKLEGRSEYLLREIDYLFGLLRYEYDPFAGYERRTTEVAGYGYDVLKRKTLTWKVEAGVGARQTLSGSGENTREGLWRLATWLKWDTGKNSSFTQGLFIEQGGENRFTESSSELKIKLNASLACKLALSVKHNSEVPVDKKNTDTKTTVTLNYDF